MHSKFAARGTKGRGFIAPMEGSPKPFKKCIAHIQIQPLFRNSLLYVLHVFLRRRLLQHLPSLFKQLCAMLQARRVVVLVRTVVDEATVPARKIHARHEAPLMPPRLYFSEEFITLPVSSRPRTSGVTEVSVKEQTFRNIAE